MHYLSSLLSHLELFYIKGIVLANTKEMGLISHIDVWIKAAPQMMMPVEKGRNPLIAIDPDLRTVYWVLFMAPVFV